MAYELPRTLKKTCTFFKFEDPPLPRPDRLCLGQFYSIQKHVAKDLLDEVARLGFSYCTIHNTFGFVCINTCITISFPSLMPPISLFWLEYCFPHDMIVYWKGWLVLYWDFLLHSFPIIGWVKNWLVKKAFKSTGLSSPKTQLRNTLL